MKHLLVEKEKIKNLIEDIFFSIIKKNKLFIVSFSELWWQIKHPIENIRLNQNQLKVFLGNKCYNQFLNGKTEFYELVEK